MSDTATVNTAVAQSTSIVTTGEPVTIQARHTSLLTPDNEAIKYFGRTKVTQEAAWMDWSASGLEINVCGGDVRIQLEAADTSDMNCTYVGVSIDGKRTQKIRLSNGTAWYTLAENLDSSKVSHVKLLKLNEAEMAVSTVKSIEVTGVLAGRSADKARNIEWIGDSITAGYGIIADQNDHFTSETEDATFTYAMLLSDYFDADYHILAASGYGVATSNGGSTTSGLIPPIYPYTSYPRGTFDSYTWDYSRFEPDLIVVNLGTNDVAGGSNAETLQKGIRNFLSTLRQAHPPSTIVWVYGVMINGLTSQIQQTVEQFAETDKQVYFIPLHQQRASNGYGADGHPNATSHQQLANELAIGLKAIMRW